ncbi:trichohyalin-like [Macrobrachium nipponense]|uniref:trichohyalin-like n=1 Tax=Macrobrachium nipponense TaxID=159736 RepID=UPI0030C8B5C4
MADSVHTEIVVEKFNSFGTSAFAVAIPGMALLAGLAFALYWIYNLTRTHRHFHLQDDLEISSEDEVILEASLETEDLEEEEMYFDEEDSLDMEQLDESDVDLETDINEEARLEDSLDMELFDTDDLDTDLEDESRLEDRLYMDIFEDTADTEDTEYTEEEEEEEKEPCLEVYLLRQGLEQMEEEKRSLEEDLDKCQDHARKMENLWIGAKEEIELLRRQLVEKNLLLEKRAEEEKEMKGKFEKELGDRGRKIDNLLQQNEQLADEKRQLEMDLKLALAQVPKMEEVNREHLEEGMSLKGAELRIKLKGSENLNELLDLDYENLCMLNEDLRNYIVEKEIEMERTLHKGAELSLKLKESETLNQLLDLENGGICRLNEDLTNVLVEKQRELERTLHWGAKLILKLKESENLNQLLEMENGDLCRRNEDLKIVLVEKEKEAELLKGENIKIDNTLAEETERLLRTVEEQVSNNLLVKKDQLEIALHQEQSLQRLLERQEEDIISFRKQESETQWDRVKDVINGDE